MKRFEGATKADAERALLQSSQELAALYAQPRVQREAKAQTISDLVKRYRGAPDGLLGLRASTRAEWSRWLDEIERVFGAMPLKALKATGVRSAFIDWRNERKNTPRAADYGIQVLARVLAYGVENEMIERNPAEGIKRLYKASRADIIVEPEELEAILSRVTAHAGRFIRLAAATGLRRGDLVDLKWSDVHDQRIERATSKSNGAVKVMVPLLADARAVLAECREERERLISEGRVPSAHVLTTAKGTPWSKDAPTQAFLRAAQAAGINKHLHDLRGTAVTKFCRAGVPDDEIAEIFGWEPSRVARIKRHYVAKEQMIQRTIERLEGMEKTG